MQVACISEREPDMIFFLIFWCWLRLHRKPHAGKKKRAQRQPLKQVIGNPKPKLSCALACSAHKGTEHNKD